MKKGFKRVLSIFVCAMVMVSAFSILSLQGFAADNTTTVYIADGGTGDGTSATSPMGTINDAIASINAKAAADSSIKAGKIILAGNYTVSASYTETAHSIPITYTSANKSSFKLIMGNNLSLKGDVTMTALEIYLNRDSETNIYAYGNKLVMGEKGVADDIVLSGSGQFRLGIVGGGNNATVAKIDVELNSGTYQLIRIGSGSSGGTVTGDVNFTFNGANVKDSVSIGGVSKSNKIEGKTNVTINSGTFSKVYLGCCGTGNTSEFGGLVTLKINGGTFSGKISTYTSGGTITFNKGCVIDISNYSGSADFDSIILASDQYTVTKTSTTPTDSNSATTTTKTATSNAPSTGSIGLVQIVSLSLASIICLATSLVVFRKRETK